MITLITGVPGAGKTLRAVWHIKRLLEAGRTVYADIDGLALPGVLPGVDDWRDTPDGSVVVYDECQRRFGPDKSAGRSANPIIAALETHRHTGHDLILITQHPGLLHAHVRRLVGRHEHLTRAYGWQRAMVYSRDEIIERVTPGALKRCERELWAYPRDLFAVYKSATIHTHKRRIPFKPALLAGVAIVGIIAVVSLARNIDPTNIAGVQVMSGRTPSAPSTAANRPTPHPPESTPAATQPNTLPTQYLIADQIGGCIVSSRACRCYSADLLPLDLSDAQCRELASHPLPIGLQIGGRSGTTTRTRSTDGA